MISLIKRWSRTVLCTLVLLSAIIASAQNKIPNVFSIKTEQQVIDMLNNGGFKVLKTLPAIPDSLVNYTLICNGYALPEQTETFQDMKFIKFSAHSFSNPVTGQLGELLNCNTIKYIFDAEMALSHCIVFVCNEGMSIYAFTSGSSLLPSAFLLFFPPSGSDNLILFATFKITGKILETPQQVSSFNISSSGTSSYSAPVKSDNEINRILFCLQQIHL